MPTAFPSARLPIAIPTETQQVVHSALETIKTALSPYLTELGPTERRFLPKMGDRSEPFVSKALSYLQANPQYAPSFLDVDHYGLNLVTIEVLRSFLGPLKQLTDMVSDSEMQSGSDALNFALVAYEAFKTAAKRNQPGAAIIVEELSARFPGRPARSTRKAKAS